MRTKKTRKIKKCFTVAEYIRELKKNFCNGDMISLCLLQVVPYDAELREDGHVSAVYQPSFDNSAKELMEYRATIGLSPTVGADGTGGEA